MDRDSVRFLRKVRIDTGGTGCWQCLGAKLPRGYGRFYYEGRARYAHRVALQLLQGVRVPADRVVMHACDNPSCVNPDHLSVGTQRDNMRDASRKGRVVYTQDWTGERNPKAKMSDRDRTDLMHASSRGASNRALAQHYGVTITRVQQIVRAAASV